MRNGIQKGQVTWPGSNNWKGKTGIQHPKNTFFFWERNQYVAQAIIKQQDVVPHLSRITIDCWKLNLIDLIVFPFTYEDYDIPYYMAWLPAIPTLQTLFSLLQTTLLRPTNNRSQKPYMGSVQCLINAAGEGAECQVAKGTKFWCHKAVILFLYADPTQG